VDIPLLKIETNYTDSNSGQILTRVEAFFESAGNRYRRAGQQSYKAG